MRRLSSVAGDNLMYIKAEALQTVNNLLDDNYPIIYRRFFKEVRPPCLSHRCAPRRAGREGGWDCRVACSPSEVVQLTPRFSLSSCRPPVPAPPPPSCLLAQVLTPACELISTTDFSGVVEYQVRRAPHPNHCLPPPG